jgi:predicted  nucleic acid-binding Zn-ribbon protein
LKDNIKKLILLQECDNKIKTNDLKRNDVPIKMKKLEETFNEVSEIYRTKFDKLDALKKERRALEQSVQDIESKADKSQIKLNSIKSNKEYTAVLKEIDDLEKEKNKKEDQILQIMEDVEEMNRECETIKDEQEDHKKEFEAEKKDIEGEMLVLDSEADELKKQRSEYCSDVDQELLKTYDFLRKNRGGIAIGAVISGICQSCHMEIPPQKFNELIKCDTMMSCPHCRRFMYWGEDDCFINMHNDIEQAG